MDNKHRLQIAIYLVICIMFTFGFSNIDSSVKIEEPLYLENTVSVELPVMNCKTPSRKIIYKELTFKDIYGYDDEDIKLIALITMAEAEGCSEYAQRLVIDTILNRVESSAWPNTAKGVIYQKGQFDPIWNGRINRCYVQDRLARLVKDEIICRTNREVIFFRSGHYFDWAKPITNDSNVYFSR